MTWHPGRAPTRHRTCRNGRGMSVAGGQSVDDDGAAPSENERSQRGPQSSLRRFLGWLGGSLLLYLLGDPIKEQVIDPLLAPVASRIGDEAVGFLFRPLAVLLIPLVVCAGILLLAARDAGGRLRTPYRFQGAATWLVVAFLGTTLWSSFDGRPWLTYLSTAALVLVAVLGIEQAVWLRGGRSAGLGRTMLALSAMLYGVTEAKIGVSGIADSSLPAVERVDTGSLALLGMLFSAFGLAILLDLRWLLTLLMMALSVQLTLWSVGAFFIGQLPLRSATFALAATATAAFVVALWRDDARAPGVAGVLRGIAGRAGTLGGVAAGAAGVSLSVDVLVLDYGVPEPYRILPAAAWAIGGLAFWTYAAALLTGQRIIVGVAGIMLGAAFVCGAAGDALVGAAGPASGSALDIPIDWTLGASAEALVGAAFLTIGGGLLLRQLDKTNRIKRWALDLWQRWVPSSP
ncbi:hypothetical protein L1785_19115 [Antribacter sp. KLBMP9083]|uniref:Uncharacterized protein n=1 Tax=Antribacter soli TaxID=2910976 RepID=A0AA41QHC5_9MICO|nr:hypothetical protein [Antribacter soli]MCF4123086.1 hypothetical protein [Antribacter soli]